MTRAANASQTAHFVGGYVLKASMAFPSPKQSLIAATSTLLCSVPNALKMCFWHQTCYTENTLFVSIRYCKAAPRIVLYTRCWMVYTATTALAHNMRFAGVHAAPRLQDWSAFCNSTNGTDRIQKLPDVFKCHPESEHVHTQLFEQINKMKRPRNLAQWFVPLRCQALFSTDEIRLQLWQQKGSCTGNRCYLQLQCTVWLCLQCLISQDFWNHWLQTQHHVTRWRYVT